MTAALALKGLGLPIGFLIGLIGIGGVLLTPALVHLFGLDIHASISLSLASFVLAGVVGAARVTTDDARLRAGDWVFLAAIVPAALAGALVAPSIPKESLSLIVSACVAFAGISCLRTPAGKNDSKLAPDTLGGLGAVTGFLSVIGGTGGPLICLPSLLWKGMEVRRALLLTQAALVNGYSASLDFAAAGIVGVSIVAGMLAGIGVSRKIDTGILRTCIAWSLVVAGLALCLVDTIKLLS
jgi:uncharacterized membrane protein YfcA